MNRAARFSADQSHWLVTFSSPGVTLEKVRSLPNWQEVSIQIYSEWNYNQRVTLFHFLFLVFKLIIDTNKSHIRHVRNNQTFCRRHWLCCFSLFSIFNEKGASVCFQTTQLSVHHARDVNIFRLSLHSSFTQIPHLRHQTSFTEWKTKYSIFRPSSYAYINFTNSTSCQRLWMRAYLTGELCG